MKALIVDDDADNRYFLEVLLKNLGHQTISAGDGAEALQRLGSEPVDMIISDILMPRMDGYALCRKCKQDPILKDIPLIFLTAAYTDEKDESFALALGADRLIRRPVEPGTLTAAIDAVLAEHGPGRHQSPPIAGEPGYLTQYNERLVSQLERKVKELQEEVTKRKRIEGALLTLSRCNQALIHAKRRTELLQELCRVIVLVGGYGMAWVGFAENDAARSIRPVAQFDQDGGYLACGRLSWANDADPREPVGEAIRTGAPQIVHFPKSGQCWCEALRRGYGYCIALPLNDDSRVFGAIAIFAADSDSFRPEEIALLTELANDLSYGVTAIRVRSQRDRITQAQRRSLEKLRDNLEDAIEAIAATLELRDPYTAGHEKRVAQLAVAIAGEMGLSEARTNGIRVAAAVHDLGKIRVPTEILTTPRALSAPEYELARLHPQVGYDILKGIDFPWPVATMVLQHHERLDGSGYPGGLMEGDILLESQIIAVADVVEAMASHRPYRPALGLNTALSEIEGHRGTLYDQAVVNACVRLFRDKGFTFPVSHGDFAAQPGA